MNGEYIFDPKCIVKLEDYNVHQFKIPGVYSVDYDKVKTLDDVIMLLKAIDMKISDNYKFYDEVKHLMKEDVDCNHMIM